MELKIKKLEVDGVVLILSYGRDINFHYFHHYILNIFRILPPWVHRMFNSNLKQNIRTLLASTDNDRRKYLHAIGLSTMRVLAVISLLTNIDKLGFR